MAVRRDVVVAGQAGQAVEGCLLCVLCVRCDVLWGVGDGVLDGRDSGGVDSSSWVLQTMHKKELKPHPRDLRCRLPSFTKRTSLPFTFVYLSPCNTQEMMLRIKLNTQTMHCTVSTSAQCVLQRMIVQTRHNSVSSMCVCKMA